MYPLNKWGSWESGLRNDPPKVTEPLKDKVYAPLIMFGVFWKWAMGELAQRWLIHTKMWMTTFLGRHSERWELLPFLILQVQCRGWQTFSIQICVTTIQSAVGAWKQLYLENRWWAGVGWPVVCGLPWFGGNSKGFGVRLRLALDPAAVEPWAKLHKTSWYSASCLPFAKVTS